MDTIREVTLEDMLAAREKRTECIAGASLTHQKPLISFTMNIPGPVKVSPLIRRGFREGLLRLENALFSAEIPFSVLYKEEAFTGCEALYVLDGVAENIKRIGVSVENSDALSRLFDLDVIDADGTAVSRTVLGFEERGCMVCGAPGRGCASRRIHDADTLRKAAEMRLTDYFDPMDCQSVSALAVESLIAEVNATPKPGLVDGRNTGSHRDMDLPLFERSAAALAPFWGECFMVGRETADAPPKETFRQLRSAGLAAEEAMFAATGGVNTHKGAIFLLGTLCGAVGRLRDRAFPRPSASDLLRECGRMSKAAIAEDFAAIQARGSQTAGEALYLTHGLRGARGELAEGFPSVRLTALPALKAALEAECEYAAPVALLHLIALGRDTNMFRRGGESGAAWGASEAAGLISGGRIPALSEIEELDQRFIEKNLSPGGCADLLAVTLFLQKWEQGE